MDSIGAVMIMVAIILFLVLILFIAISNSNDKSREDERIEKEKEENLKKEMPMEQSGASESMVSSDCDASPTQSEDELREQIKREILEEMRAKKGKRSTRATWAAVLLFLQVASFAGRIIQYCADSNIDINAFAAIFVASLFNVSYIVSAILILMGRKTETQASLFSKQSLAILLIFVQVVFNVALVGGTALSGVTALKYIGYYFLLPMFYAIIYECLAIIAVILLIVEEKNRRKV